MSFQTLGILQREDKAYMRVLFTLTISLKTKKFRECIFIQIFQPLITALRNKIRIIFGHLFKDMNLLLSFAFHLHFEWGWLKLLDGKIMANIDELSQEVTKQIRSLVETNLPDNDENSSSDSNNT